MFGAFGKYFTLIRLAEKAVVDIAADPTKRDEIIQTVGDVAKTIQLEESFEPGEVAHAVDFAMALHPHTAAAPAAAAAAAADNAPVLDRITALEAAVQQLQAAPAAPAPDSGKTKK